MPQPQGPFAKPPLVRAIVLTCTCYIESGFFTVDSVLNCHAPEGGLGVCQAGWCVPGRRRRDAEGVKTRVAVEQKCIALQFKSGQARIEDCW
eukprot:scaffold322313_cov15-Tisochrysis_lutea.AAC.1